MIVFIDAFLLQRSLNKFIWNLVGLFVEFNNLALHVGCVRVVKIIKACGGDVCGDAEIQFSL